MRWHWQNLNEKYIGGERVKGRGLRHGRAWFHFEKHVFEVDWKFLDKTFAHGFSFHPDERKILYRFCIPLISLYFSLSGVDWPWLWEKTKRKGRPYGTPRDLEFRIFGWGLWLDIWSDEMETGRDDPWWWRWHLDIPDFLLGRNKYENVKHGDPKRIWIPLPEGLYLAEAQYETSTWKRRRFPWWPFKRVRHSTKVDVLDWNGLPHEGKGENSWDCGRDGVFGYSVDGHNLDTAIAHGVEITLKARSRYGGRTQPSPLVTRQAGVKAFAKNAAHLILLRRKYPKWGKILWRIEDLPEGVQGGSSGGNALIIVTEEGDKYTHRRAMHCWKSLAQKFPRLLEEQLNTVVLKDDDSVAEARA